LIEYYGILNVDVQKMVNWKEKFDSPVPSDPTVVGVVWWVAIIPELVREWKLLSNSWSRVARSISAERVRERVR